MNNPILNDCEETKKEYLKRLDSYIGIGQWKRRKFGKAQMAAYKKIIMDSGDEGEKRGISYYKFFMLLDIIQILGYKVKKADADKFEKIKARFSSDYHDADTGLADRVWRAFQGSGKNKHKKIQALAKSSKLKNEEQYIGLMLQNIKFMEAKPASVMVTATMSAGKSTFINALTGKRVCLSQTMACTSKLNGIVNKAFEDGYSYKYDYDLGLTAEPDELLKDNELNASDKIMTGTHFTGSLGNQRMIISDSPGVNYSRNQEHKSITYKYLKGRNYNLLIYIMNATQLGTNDEDEHLGYVKSVAGKVPILFVVNKIDTFNVEEEDIGSAILCQKEYLSKKGFKNPMVCPVSAKAGYLSKRFLDGGLSKMEERELYHMVDKFSHMELPSYYYDNFHKIVVRDNSCEELQLLKTCGLAYIEKIIIALTTGGKINGANLR